MNGIFVFILEATVELFQSCYYALELYQRLPMKIRAKLPLDETSPMDRQKWCIADMAILLQSMRITLVDILSSPWSFQLLCGIKEIK